jgi:hypothetical protein
VRLSKTTTSLFCATLPWGTMLPSSSGATDTSAVREAEVSSPDVGPPASRTQAFISEFWSDIREGARGLMAWLDRPHAALLLLVPVAIYFLLVYTFGVNAIWYDQWDNIALLTHSHYFFHSYAGPTSLSSLWGQHNENRMLFPNLVVLALGSLTHLNVVTEEYLSAVLIAIAVSLIILANRRDLAPVPWIVYLPLAFVMLSLGQSGDTLFGFQLAWYMVLLALALVVFLLDSPRANWALLVVAIGVAVIGSYSSLQGLFIWPTGLVVLLWKYRPRSWVLTWLATGVVTTVIYFYNFDFSSTGTGQSHYSLAHPITAVEFFFLSIGDVMGKPLPEGPGALDPVILAVGVATFLLAVACLVVYGRGPRRAKSPVGLALICFGLLFVLSITYGRVSAGLAAASQSRYATFDLLILAGCYLCLIERRPATSDDQNTGADPDGEPGCAVNELETIGEKRRSERVVLSLRLLAAVLIVWMVWAGAENGVASGRSSQALMERAALVTAHAQVASNTLVESALLPNKYVAYGNVRDLAALAKKQHLSFFATGEATRLENMALPKGGVEPPPVSSVVKPAAGSVVTGAEFFVARANADFPITRVEFEISGATSEPAIVVRAVQFPYGWLGGWISNSVPNGSYSIRSIVHDTAGQMSTSRATSFTVSN